MAEVGQRAIWRYLAYARPYRWLIAVMVFAGIAKFTLPLVPAWITQLIVDDVIRNAGGAGASARRALLWQCAGGLAAVAVLEVIAFYVRGVSTVNVGSSISFDLRHSLWKHLQRLSLNFHQSRPTGKLLSRLMSDVSVSQQMISGGIANVLIDSVSGIAALAVALSISWRLTLLVLLVLPIYGVLYRKMNPRIRRASHEVQEQTSVMSGMAVERLNGIAVVQSFAQEPAEAQRFAAEADELRGRHVKRGKLNQILKAGSAFLTAVSVGMVWVVGAQLAIAGRISPGQIIRFLGTAALLFQPIRRLSEINIIYQNSMAAIERIFAIFDVTPEVRQKRDALDRVPQSGKIEFDHVEFNYEGRPPALSDLNFTIAPGERVAIVGESGAGKSTLVTLIPRLYDVTGGAIRIDDVDVRDYKLRKLRKPIGIVLQETILFSDTVLENLRYGRKDATHAEIIEAANAANADEFIRRLPEGYETLIGERGLNLSGGQRQRLSLARTILQNPRILLLDEATSSLDSESENLITEALERVMSGRSCVIIAHRLSTVMVADRLLVLKEGQLAEQGPHAELLAAGGYYRYLFEQQFGPLQEMLSDGRSAGAV